MFQRIRFDDAVRLKREAARRTMAIAGWRLRHTSFALLTGLLCGICGLAAHGQTFQITGVTYAPAGNAIVTTLPAGVNGVVLTLAGTLPSAAQQAASTLLACFYTGYGSTSGIPLSLPNGSTEPLTIPASTIQSIPQANFTSANNYSVTAKLYFIAGGNSCNGTFDSTLTNQYVMQIVAPSLGAYSGPAAVPQTNSSTNVQAPPAMLTLPANGLLYSGAYGSTANTSVNFGSFGSVPLNLPLSYAYIAVPSAFSASPVGTTASLSICNTFASGTSGTYTVCTTPSPAITLTVAALAASTGTIVATPDPVLTSGQTVLTAQFAKAPSTAQTSNPGAPSGTVSFAATGATISPAKLILDKTAVFTPLTSTVTTPAAATPVISPTSGTYTGSQSISFTDATAGAAIYYTQDGSTPTTASALYTGPLTIGTSQTIQAIAAASGVLNSAVASSAYTINLLPPSQLAFTVQPVNTLLNTAITPAVQVAVEDSQGNIVTNSSAAVTLGLFINGVNQPLGGTTTVNAVNGIATFSTLTVGSVFNGLYLTATSGTLQSANSTTFNVTPPPITMMVQSALIGIASTLTGSFTLGSPAPAGGTVVNLLSSTPANATISPASVTVAQGQTTGSFTYTGVAAGPSTLSASATGYQTGTVQVAGTAAQVSIGTVQPVAPGQSLSLAVSLATPAPAGGTTVTFAIGNTNIATVTASVFVPAGLQTPTANPQITGVLIGTTTVTASAPGYAPAVRAVNVTVTATFNPATTSINLSTSTNTVLNISAPAPAGGITFTLSSNATSIATVPASVTVIQGATSVAIPITGVTAGTTTILANSPGVAQASGTVDVSSAINGGTLTTGYDLENSIPIYLPVSPPNPVTVTMTVNNPAIATISNSGTVVGQTTLTFTNITSTYIGTIYVQGHSVGSTTITISAPGYTTGTTTITVDPSGFFIYSPGSIATTSFSSPTAMTVYTAVLNPGTLTVYDYDYQINPGVGPVTVPIASSAPAVGTLSSSSLVFNAGSYYQQPTFQPVSVGTSNIALGAPSSGFSTATQSQQITATVTAPVITVNNTTTGVNLQSTLQISLPVAPPTPETVTVTVPLGTTSPAAATISTSQTVAGGTTLTFTNVTTAYVGAIYAQGQSVGSSTVTVSAPGYTSGTGTITVDPSGFFIYSPGSIATTTFSSPTSMTIFDAILNPGTLTVYDYGYPLNPGVGTVTVPITSSAPSVGTLSSSSLIFNASNYYQQPTFQPVSAGTTNIKLGTPAGYSTPSQNQQITATVSAPAIIVGSVITGVNLQNTLSISLPVAPPNPVTVTVSVPVGTLVPATLSNSQTVAGVTTLTFTNVTSTFVGTVYVQGQSVGSSTLTVSAPGYTSGTGTITVDPSGFIITTSSFTTTTFSSPTTLTVYDVILNPGTLTIYNYGYPLNPGVGPVTVSITSSAPAVGTLSSGALVFSASGTPYQQTNFQPVSAGTTTIALGATPAGFSTASQNQQLTATVSAPVINVGNVVTGLNLEYPLNIYLPVAPPNPVTVTVTSNGPAIATISNSGTVVGGTTLTFTNVTSPTVGTIYVQGQSVGTTTVTVSAPGYTNGNGTITVYPSGFIFASPPNFSTTATSSPTSFYVYTAVLNPGTLTVNNYNLQLSSGIGNVNVPVVSSNTGVGTITTSPLVFTPGTSYILTSFQPIASGTSTITVQTPASFSTPSQNTQGTATVQ